MESEIFVYVEGGKLGKTVRQLRVGLRGFLKEIDEIARSRKIRMRIVPSGSTRETYRNFLLGARNHPDAFNVLLVDSEGALTGKRRDHLARLVDDGTVYDFPDDQIHMMVQAMEAWIIADPEALANFYGQGFNRRAIPDNPNVEQIVKQDVLRGLEKATQRTQKGKYHKTKHAFKLLEKLDASKVCNAAPHCARLFTTIRERM